MRVCVCVCDGYIYEYSLYILLSLKSGGGILPSLYFIKPLFTFINPF